MNMVESSVSKLRLSNNNQLPSWYDWRLHLILNTVILISAMIIGFSRLTHTPLSQYLLIAPFFFLWSVVEYGIHRFILHSNIFLKSRLGKEHSVSHHGYFNSQFMALSEKIDVNRILLFPVDLLSVILLNALISTLIGLTFNTSLGWIFFAAGVLYIATYELIHAICHLDLKNSFFNYFIDHHRTHHDSTLMSRKNFSVVFPFLDSLLGSKQNSVALLGLQWKTIPHGTKLAEEYVREMSKFFPRLPNRDFHQAKHIAVYHQGILVGGATLEEHKSLDEDNDISKHWKINNNLPATRISRLWNRKQAMLPFIFEGITKSVSKDTFLYGILSLPLFFATKNEQDFLTNNELITPYLPLHDCQWKMDSTPSSEGKKLLVTYKRIGAQFLGPASGNSEDKSIRVVMGMRADEAKLPDARKYETTSL